MRHFTGYLHPDRLSPEELERRAMVRPAVSPMQVDMTTEQVEDFADHVDEVVPPTLRED
jgi:transposase-like protein